MIDFENLPRWIYASSSKYINDQTPGTLTFFEGLDKDDDPQNGAEFRMDGPRLTQLSKGYWEVWVAINILIQTTMDDDDFHRKYVTAGKIVDALNSAIPIFKFGDGPNDDSSLVGCLTVIHDKFNRIQVNHFGQIDKTVRLEQATVEAHYRMYLSEES